MTMRTPKIEPSTLADASSFEFGDIIYDFTDNEDRIGLADVTFEEVSWVDASWADDDVSKQGVRLYHTETTTHAVFTRRHCRDSS